LEKQAKDPKGRTHRGTRAARHAHRYDPLPSLADSDPTPNNIDPDDPPF